MAITLAQAKLTTADAFYQQVIDEFRKDDYILNHIPFEQAVTPVGGGATLTYGYVRLIQEATAAFRAVNEEYAAQEAKGQKYSVDLKIFGGAFEVDRVIASMGGIVDHVTLQMQQKIKAAKALFADTVINGDSSANAKAFDGLDIALAGTSTEVNTGSGKAIDLTTYDKIKANGGAFLLTLNLFLQKLDGKPSCLLCNGNTLATLQTVAKESGRYQETKDEWGNQVTTYNGIPLVNPGAKSGSNEDIIATGTDGTASLYAVRFGVDGFHAVSTAGQLPVQAWLPNFSTAGAVKKGEVEMLAAVALKATRAAGVFRGLKVAQ
jgi:hypothetical protein